MVEMTEAATFGEGGRQAPARVRNRRRVLRAARQIAADRGLDGLTMRAIALEADMSVATLYNLVGGRDDVVRALGRQLCDELDEAFVYVEEADPLERAHGLLDMVADTVIATVPRQLLLMLLSDVHLYTDLIPAWGPADALARDLGAMVGAGLITADLDPTIIARHIWWSHMGYLRQWAAGRLEAAEFKAAALYSLDLCLLAIATSTGRPRLLEHARNLELQLRGI